MDIQIREAKSKDASIIEALRIASWKVGYKGIIDQEFLDEGLEKDSAHKNYTRQNHNLLLDKSSGIKIWIAFTDAVAVGFARTGKSRDSGFSGYAELQAIYNHPNYYGKGVGRNLFGAAVNHVRDQGYQKMFVRCLKDNTQARSFYECMGGQLIADREGTVFIGDRNYPDIKYEWPDLTQI